ncbi:MAG: hypothetical protein D6782_02985 [Alphaproteobacteria bacterium]|nr:MAG: hypothetical protein D6782_02985 [Alphaproteobacteria bacterium]
MQAAKQAEAVAKARREEVEAQLVEAMRKEGQKRIELSDGIKAALVTRKVVDRKALESDPEWQALCEKLGPLEAQKKEIEQRHKAEGAAYVRLSGV